MVSLGQTHNNLQMCRSEQPTETTFILSNNILIAQISLWAQTTRSTRNHNELRKTFLSSRYIVRVRFVVYLPELFDHKAPSRNDIWMTRIKLLRLKHQNSLFISKDSMNRSFLSSDEKYSHQDVLLSS